MRRLAPVLLLLLLVPITRVSLDPPLRDYAGVLHCHSLLSHDSKGTFEEILAAARAAKIDFIVMTDHPPKGDAEKAFREGWRGLRQGVLFIQGAEYAGDHLLAVGTRAPVSGPVPEKIAAIRRQGGLSFVSHPEDVEDWTPYLAADGMEIYNAHAALKAAVKRPGFLKLVYDAVKNDPERSYQLLRELDPAVLARWDEINRARPFVGIAANDAHQNTSFFGLRLDPYPRAFRFVRTIVRARALTEEGILDALRAGRCRVVFEEEASPGEVERRVLRAGDASREELRVRGRPWVIENWKR